MAFSKYGNFHFIKIFQTQDERAEKVLDTLMGGQPYSGQTLDPRWRLVSLNEVKVETDINSVFPIHVPVSIVMTYDSKVPGGWLSASRDESGLFLGSLETIDPQLAYFVFYDEEDSMEQPTPGGYWSLVSASALVPARDPKTILISVQCSPTITRLRQW